MRENRTHGSEGGEDRWSFSTPIKGKALASPLQALDLSAQSATISKSSLRAPHSGQVQFMGTSAHKVPAAMPCSGAPAASS